MSLDAPIQSVSAVFPVLHGFAEDLAGVERALQPVGSAETTATASAQHVLRLPGKRLRPLCVVLAARVGTGFSAAAQELAVAVELVHNATLLHDDVVDLGEVRRGVPAARVIYGNASSIFGGDWLLVEALRRVERSGIPGTLPRLLSAIEEMILAESLQLDRRGRLSAKLDDYLRVIEGKTAALFRWALFAGARAGGLSPDATAALEEYGSHLGAAFQVVDDVLDYDGEAVRLGKKLFADIGEGKMTLPLIFALERRPALRPLLESMPEDVGERVVEIMRESGALIDARRFAAERAERAVACLDRLPSNEATLALAAVAQRVLDRQS